MTLSPGTRFGPYEVVALVGAGGMGEVYRARDARLNRDVALKILPAAFALDADRIARFKREAQVLASLNHPNIAAIHGLEESNGGQALVLELVEGPTLADRIAQGALVLGEALPIARQIAEALEAAHEQGIIHRDLKPANIKVRDDGTVKVLDFGLAKVSDAGASVSGPGGLTQSPTITSPALMTGAGVILGTAAYMSPEQARGRTADKRSDVWGFGCVLFEMLAGKRAFDGMDTTDVIAAVVRGEPDWTALPASVPSRIRDIIKRCLEKDRKARIPEISVVRYLMDGIEPDAAVASGTSRLSRGFRASLIAGAVGIGAASALATWLATRPAPPPKPDPVRFTIRPPEGMLLSTISPDRDIAITPDGKHVVYRVGAGIADAQLVLQPTDQLDAVPIRGLGSARSPFVSADGRWVGFESGDELKKVSIGGGPPLTVCRLRGNLRGASWGADNTIVFATNDRTSGLFSVPAGGGEPKVLTTPDPSSNEQDHLYPSFLPGGRAVLFTVSLGAQADNARVAVLDLQTGQRKTLIQGGSQPDYVETGHLLYATGGTLRAVGFDPKRLEVLGDPVPVVDKLLTKPPSGAAGFAVSRTGTLVHLAGNAAPPRSARSLVWVDRRGREQPINVPPRNYAIARLSPDATRIALDIRDQDNDIWIWDLARETLIRLTTDPANDLTPVWTPDGRRIVFASTRGGAQNIFWQPADGTTPPERLTTSVNVQYSHSISADGRQVILTEGTSTARNNVSVLHLEEPSGAPKAESSKRRTEPIIQSRFGETGGDLSKDGRWIAYESNESGQNEIYVQPFPNMNGGRWIVSTNGGTRPVWSSNGREIFYAAGNPGAFEASAVMAVPVQTTPTFSAGKPTKLFDWLTIGLNPSRGFDVSPDGQKFLMIKEPKRDEAPAAPASIVVTLNWLEELKARVPTR